MRGGPGRTIDNPISDDFQRASLGGNWTNHLGNGSIVSSADWGPSASSGIHISSWTATALGVDQVIEAPVAVGIDAQMESQIYGRRRSSDSARYGFHYDFEAGTPRWEIKYDGVASEFTRSLATTSAIAAPGAGTVLRLEIRGSGATVTLKGYKDGLLVLETTDTHADRITAAGTPGLVCRAFVGQTLTYPSPVFATFAAGTLL